jgi:uncharacterized protein (TIGR02145 family)
MVAILNGCKKEEKVSLPVLSSTIVTNISGTSGTSGGNITSDGGAPINARGVCWSTANNPTVANSKTKDGSGIGVFSSNITGLSEGTTYHVRAYAVNLAGTAYGEDLLFSTFARPIVTTTNISDITLSAAVSGGNITSDGGKPVTDRGVCWSTTNSPTINDSKTSDGEGLGSFVSSAANLAEGTTYFIRAFATNSIGTAYGNQFSFTTNLTDLDGNVYHTVTLETQVWLIENLKVTHYSNGDIIPDVTSGSTWDSLTTGAYCAYYNDNDNATIYGNLYNGYVVLDNRGVCPIGWHVPNSTEFNELQTNIGGIGNGGKLKEMGFAHWISPNTGATNETGFTALPSGDRIGHSYGSDGFQEVGLSTSFWQKEISSDTSYFWGLNNYSSTFIKNSYTYPNTDALLFGFSLRCIKN